MRDNLSTRVLLLILFLSLFTLGWAPWLNNEEIRGRILLEKADKDGTMGWVVYPNGTRVYQMICDYKVTWLPFGRRVASCEGGYYVTFWNKIIP